jgi:hypothetical protein
MKITLTRTPSATTADTRKPLANMVEVLAEEVSDEVGL